MGLIQASISQPINLDMFYYIQEQKDSPALITKWNLNEHINNVHAMFHAIIN